MSSDVSDADTATRIVKAIRRALIEHRYDDLSTAKVAAKFDGNQSLIHYHFDSLEGLLVALLERERELYLEYFEEFPGDPKERLDRLIDTLVGKFTEWAEESGMAPWFGELSAAATDSEPIQTTLRDLYALIREQFERSIADGIEAGVFEPIDPACVARLLLAGNESAMQRWLVSESDEILEVVDALEAYILTEVRR